MDKLDTKFIAHVGVELAVISGLAFFFYKQNSDLKSRVTDLEQKVQQIGMMLMQGPPQGQQRVHRQEQPRQQPRPQPRHQPQEPDDYDEEELDEIIDQECENGVCPLPQK